MFRPEKVEHATLILPENKINRIITKLHEHGICELKEADIELKSKYSYEYSKETDEICARLRYIINSLEEYREIPQPENLIKALFSPRQPLKHKTTSASPEELREEAKRHLDLIEPKITEKLDRLSKIGEKMDEHNFVMSNLSLMPDVKTDLFEPTENIKVLIGMINTASFLKIQEALRDNTVIITEEKDKDRLLAMVIALQEDSQDAERILHDIGFEKLEIPYEHKKPSSIITGIKKSISQLEEKKRDIESSLEKLQKVYGKKLDVLQEEMDICMERINALKNFKATEAFSVLEAWLPSKNLEKFNQIMKKECRDYYLEIEEKDDAPTIFKNPKYIKPFELITNLYGAPKYKGFDPTPLLAVSFALFFGFMLTDAAYGILLVLLGYGMYRGAGRYNESIKNFGAILTIFGISTSIMGIIFGSYFGDFFQKIGINLPVPIDSMRQVMLVLLIALSLGSIHLITGLVSGFYENVHKKDIKEAFASQGVWLFFMLGAILVVFKLTAIGAIAIGISVVMQLFFNFLKGGTVSSVLSIFGFSSFMGDLFSYARLMALAIGTSGIALAVNFMVLLAAGLIPILGIPIAIIIFIIGHLFNMAMNGLGAFIHSTRLHFLEFFQKFYEGGGRVYKPFQTERKITYVELL